MDILRKIFEEINKKYSKEELSPYKPGQGQGQGQSQGQGKGKGQKQGNGSGGQEQKSNQDGSGQDISKDIEDINKAWEEKKKNGSAGKINREFDDHLEDIAGDDWDKNTVKDIIKGAKDWERSHPPTKDSEKTGGGGEGRFKAEADNLLNEQILNPAVVREILHRLKRYKAKLAEEQLYRKSQLRHKHSARANSNILGTNKIKVKKDNEASAFLLMAIDTSGSMWDPSLISMAYSVMNQIAKAFTMKENPEDPDGIVLAFNWDTRIAGSPRYREWKFVTESDLAQQLSGKKKKMASTEYYGGGGNDFNAVLKELDDDFVIDTETSENGRKITRKFFHLDPKDKMFVGDNEENPDGIGNWGAIKVPLAEKSKGKNIIRKDSLGSGSENLTDLTSAPFMIVFTDGYNGEKINISSSELYRNSQANVLYVLAGTGNNVTTRDISPKNYVILTQGKNNDTE